MADDVNHEDDRSKKKLQGNTGNKKITSKKRKEKEWEEVSRLRSITESDFDYSSFSTFNDYPISNRTLQGLEKCGYGKPTEIQQQGLALGLKGCDILGAAKTGSGKTLAFLIPVMELLWREKWTKIHGLGALIITPTRELAYQIFEVLKKIGFRHDFSAGLIIGGKDMAEESERIHDTNIIICTPGRLLQHMDETPGFDCNSLKILVLDEADRILDLGFAKTMNAIIENLPEERQTLLYSATQTKSVKDLARLSLKDPEYVAVHQNSQHSTPQNLSQSYIVCELQEKFNLIYSFIRNHLKSKTLVFLSSCKQVKFTYEVIRRLQPGVPLMALYGKQKQLKRVGIYETFCRKKFAVLFATDIAARGLDFPSVDWVIQLDCPEDANTYIHRAGRTARYNSNGQALLVLLPSEEKGMMKQLGDKKIPLELIRPNAKKIQDLSRKLQAFCAQSQEVKHWAQKSVVSYVRSVFLQSNKEVFDVHSLPIAAFASSIGLLVPPRIRFMQKLEKKIGAVSLPTHSAVQSKQDGLTIKEGLGETERQSENEDDMLVVKKRGIHMDLPDAEEAPLEPAVKREVKKQRNQSKAALAKKLIRKNITVNKKTMFNEDGEEELSYDAGEPTYKADQDENEGGLDVEKAKVTMRLQDKIDKKVEREKIRTKRREKRLKERRKRQADGMDDGVQLEVADDDASDEGSLDAAKEDTQNDGEPTGKKRKRSKATDDAQDEMQHETIAEDEEIALQLLSGST